jgi:hypothetical protein
MNIYAILAIVAVFAVVACVHKYGAGDYLSKLYIEYTGSKIIFVPDTEGNVVAFVALLCEALYVEGFDKDMYQNTSKANLFHFWMKHKNKLRVKSGYAIIGGGDTIDKHFSNIYPEFVMYNLYEFWVALKENNPNKVFLISGNRDSNKTRIVPLMRKFHSEANGKKEFSITPDFAKSFNGCADESLKNGLLTMMDKGELINEIKFICLILDKTMGINSTDFLLHIRKQVSLRVKREEHTVTDKEVVAQFIANFSVGSAWHKYMKYSSIYHIIGGNLFSHCVPVPYKSDGTQCFDLKKVCGDLNTFYTSFVGQISVDGADWSKWDTYWLPNKKSWATTQPDDVNFKSTEYRAWLSALKQYGIKNLVSGHLPVGATPSIQCLKEFGITIFRLDMHTQMTAINVRTGMPTTENICHFKFSPNGAWTCDGTVFGTNYTSSGTDPNLELYGEEVTMNGEKWVVRNICNGLVHLHYFRFTPASNGVPPKWETKYEFLSVNHPTFNGIKINLEVSSATVSKKNSNGSKSERKSKSPSKRY